jgi:hypothetical protein
LVLLTGALGCAASLCYAQAAAPPPAQGPTAPLAQTTAALPSAQEIMARVAANQDQAEAERAHYVYVQHAKMASRKGRVVLCEELTDYRITPSSDGSHDELLKLDGRLRVKGKYVSYNALKPDDDDQGGKKDKDAAEGDSKDKESKDTDSKNKGSKGKDSKDSNDRDSKGKDAAGKDSTGNDATDKDDHDPISVGESGMDRDLVENMRKNLMHDKSKDGINAHLFPLTTKEQGDYVFQLEGRERLNGRDVFHITFRPKDKSDFGWKGNAFVDATAYQPVLVTTEMSRKIPFAVRTFLGTNVPGLGFTVIYAPQPDGVWFPVSFSTEFKIHVLFFFNRDIVLDAQNREFEKTHVTSRMLEGATEVP